MMEDLDFSSIKETTLFCAKYGYLDMLRLSLVEMWAGYFAKSRYHVWNRYMRGNTDRRIWEVAAQNGRLEILKWCKEMGLDWGSEVLKYAVKGRQLETSRWLYDQGESLKAEIFREAVDNYDREIIRWLCNEKCPFSDLNHAEYTLSFNGDLQAIKYLRTKTNTSSAHVLDGSARGGHLDNLKWFIQRGVGCRASVLRNAIMGGNDDTIRYLIDRRVNINVDTLIACLNVGREDLFRILSASLILVMRFY